MGGINAINDRELREAKKRMRAVVDRYLSIGIRQTAQTILEHIREHGKYFDVTGNTAASISCGIYHGGKLSVIFQPFKKEAQRVTLVKGESVEVGRDERNKPKFYTAETGEEHYYGSDRAAQFLAGYKPSRRGWAVVFCTGTEYSTYLEAEKDKNVLTDSAEYVRQAGVSIIGGRLIFSKAEHSLGAFEEMPFLPDDIEVPF